MSVQNIIHPVTPTVVEDVGTELKLDKLYPAIVECFAIILLGYLAGRMRIIVDLDAKGLNTFVAKFSLPALIFISICDVKLDSVNWMFMFSIFISKLIIFVSVLIVSLLIYRPINFGRAGIFAIFCTQSNDFAIGFPIVQAIYGEKHADFSSYMYLFAPISLIFLNPIGFIFMEIEKQRREADDNVPVSQWKMAKKVLQGVITNPIVFMTLLGICGNLIFKHSMPSILRDFLVTLGSAFSASALFILGLCMVGKVKSVGNAAIVAPFLLIVAKCLVLPLVAREVVSQLLHSSRDNGTLEWTNFGFLYGTLPTAPGVFVYASNYGVDADLVATSLVGCTFASAPLMFISANMLSITNLDPTDYLGELDLFIFNISIIGLICTTWVCVVLCLNRKTKELPYSITLSLTVSQGIACIGAIIWSSFDCNHGWKLFLQVSIFSFGVFSSRLFTALLAIFLVLLQVQNECLLEKLKLILIPVVFGISTLLSGILMLFVKSDPSEKGKKQIPNFQYGHAQAIIALIVLFFSFSMTAVALVLHQRNRRRYMQYSEIGDSSQVDCIDEESETNGETSRAESDDPQPEGSRTNSSFVSIEDIAVRECSTSRGDNVSGRQLLRNRCSLSHRQYCSRLLRRYRARQESLAEMEEREASTNESDPKEIFRHTVLLILLLISMFTGIALCIWTLVMDEISGIYLEVAFLDGALNFGQGLFAFVLFGWDARLVILPLVLRWRRFRYGVESLVLPPWNRLAPGTKVVCEQFLNYHLEHCMDDVVKSVKHGFKVFRDVFRGRELVDYLLKVGLCHSRSEAVAYGQDLVKGRVIRHVENFLDFYDECYLYTFEPAQS